MPTFTAIALENLLEPTVRDSASKSLPVEQERNKNGPAPAKKSSNFYISPALYTTPKSTHISDPPAPFSPSPYVVNHKRREPRLPEAANRFNGFEVQEKLEEEKVSEGMTGEGVVIYGSTASNLMGEVCSKEPFSDEESVGNCLKVKVVEDNGEWSVNKKQDCGESPFVVSDRDIEGDDFFDPRDSMSAASGSETENGCSFRHTSLKHLPMTSPSDFYDAAEEFSSDGSGSLASHSFGSDIEGELRTARLNLFMEIETRKKAEEALRQLRNQWQRIARSLSQVGISFPVTEGVRNMLPDIDATEQFCQELLIARFVSMAVGRGQARAEAEAAAEAVINSKSHEISRLRDKLQYCEAVNREMSQRNQEVTETSRRLRQWRKMKQRWIWGCIGLSITIGASVLAYSYLPREVGKNPLPASDDIRVSLPKSGRIHP